MAVVLFERTVRRKRLWHEEQDQSMPTVLRQGPYRFFFYAGDRDEPAHIHVEREDRIAEFWLDPVRLHRSGGMRRAEIAEVLRILVRHRDRLLEAWNEYFRG